MSPLPLSLLALALWTSISSRKRGCRRLKTCVEAVERSSRVPKASGELAGLCWMVLVERSGKPRSMPDTRQDDTLPLGYVCVPTCSHRPLELLPSSLFGLFLWYYIGLAWRSLPCQPMRWQNMGQHCRDCARCGHFQCRIWCVVLTTHSKKKNPETELLNRSPFSLECGDPFLFPSRIFGRSSLCSSSTCFSWTVCYLQAGVC